MKVQVLITTLPVSQQKVVQQYQSVHQSINQSIMNQSQQRYDSIKWICQRIGNLFSCEAVASAVDSFLYSFCDWKNLSILASMIIIVLIWSVCWRVYNTYMCRIARIKIVFLVQANLPRVTSVIQQMQYCRVIWCNTPLNDRIQFCGADTALGFEQEVELKNWILLLRRGMLICYSYKLINRKDIQLHAYRIHDWELACHCWTNDKMAHRSCERICCKWRMLAGLMDRMGLSLRKRSRDK